MKIGIINVGLGNVASILRMLDRVGSSGYYISSPEDCLESDALILPGVGHFDEVMRALRNAKLAESIEDRVLRANIPVLGICLGMQLLCRGSEEGSETGLGFIDADVRRFRFPTKVELKVPHMGWNVVRTKAFNPLLSEAGDEQRFYFVHSYRVVPDDDSSVIGTTNYGGEFCAAFQKGHIFGVQFHPEKSHRFGMELLKRFVNYSARTK